MGTKKTLTGKELLGIGNDTLKNRFNEWRQVRNIDAILQYGVQERGWNVTPQKLGKLFLSEQKRLAEGWYASFADAYDRPMLGHDAALPDAPSLEDRYEEALAALKVNSLVGMGKLMQLVDDDHLPAIELAADHFMTGYYVKRDCAKAYDLAMRAHEKGSRNILGLLAYQTAYGHGTDIDLDASRQYFVQALRSGQGANLKWLALCYLTGRPMGQNPRLSVAYFQEASEANDILASVMFFDLVTHNDFPIAGLDADKYLRISGAVELPIGLVAVAMADLRDIINGKYSQVVAEFLLEMASELILRASDRNLFWAESILAYDDPIRMPNGEERHISEFGMSARDREIAVESQQHLVGSISSKN